jgi:hypothetical protein
MALATVPCAPSGSLIALMVRLGVRKKLTGVLLHPSGVQTKVCTLPTIAPDELMAAGEPNPSCGGLKGEMVPLAARRK